MRYSNYIGIVASCGLIGACFLEWVYIRSLRAGITGVYTLPTNFGKPGFLHLIFAVVACVFFLLPYTWAKRTNVFVAALNLAWVGRNFLVITQCQMGECPEKKPGIYLVIIFSILLFCMSVLPKNSVVKPGESAG